MLLIIYFKGKTKYVILLFISALFIGHPHQAHATTWCQYADIDGQSDTGHCNWYATVGDIDQSSIKIELPPQYITTTQKERHFTPDRFTPFDDIQVSFTVPCPLAHAQIWDEEGSFAGKGYYGDGYYSTYFGPVPHLGVSLLTEDATGKDVFIASLGTAVDKYYGPDDGTPAKEDCTNVQNPRTHTFVVHGWPYSLAASTGLTPLGVAPPVDTKNLEILIDSIKNHRKVWISIGDTSKDSTPIKRDIPTGGRPAIDGTPPIDDCVQVWGDGFRKAVEMRGRSSGLDALGIMGETNAMKTMFANTAPFSENMHNLSIYTDLANYNDTGWMESAGLTTIGPDSLYSISTCKNRTGTARLYYFHFDHDFIESNGVVYKNSFSEKYKSDIYVDKYEWGNIPYYTDSVASMHETGHAFGGLDDEYSPGNILVGQINRNCVYPTANAEAPDGFKYFNKFYGNLNSKGCTFANAYRSTNNSFMRRPFEPDGKKFSIVDCSYITSVMTGLDAKYYLNPCSTMDTVKPDGFLTSSVTQKASTLIKPSPTTTSKPTSTPLPTYSPHYTTTPIPTATPYY